MVTTHPLAVVAVGGNALIVSPQRQSIPDQAAAATVTAGHIVDIVAAGWRVVITHGNGPQVGHILRRAELALHELPPTPMDTAGAETQGLIGYLLQRALHNELRQRGIRRDVTTVLTQVEVAQDDPAFAAPSKPIGSRMPEAEARRHAAAHGWQVRRVDGGDWRRVVASPRPRRIVELAPIRELAATGNIVIACGGGGIPVLADGKGLLSGVEAVIDKDFSSALLALALGAELLLIATTVEHVSLDFGTPRARPLERMTLGEARAHAAQGQFPPGSMGPKIEAMCDFVADGGRPGVITDPPNIARALAGETGTWLVPDAD